MFESKKKPPELNFVLNKDASFGIIPNIYSKIGMKSDPSPKYI